MRISIDELEDGMEVVINYYPVGHKGLLSLRCTILIVFEDTIFVDLGVGEKFNKGILKSSVSQIILLKKLYDSDLGV